jgi:hypothetical protein
MADMKFGLDVYVCDSCKAIVTKPVLMMAGNKCPECGCENLEVRGKYFDQRIWIDGFLAQGDGAEWAKWAKDGFLIDTPEAGLEKLQQR